MLYNFFDNLRTKPKVVRDQFALVGAVCFTAIIGGVWSLSIPARLGTVASSASTTSVASVTTAPLSGFVAQLKSQFKTGKNMAALPLATSTGTPTAASSAEAALGLQLTPKNRQVVETTSSTIRFGTTTIAPPAKPVMATTTSATSSPNSATSSRF